MIVRVKRPGESVKNALSDLSRELRIPMHWLFQIIKFESNFNPQAKNPYSSARGLIQFIDSTARDLGYNSSLDLVTKHPSIVSQIKGPVRRYFLRYYPFPTKSSFYMSVFYPKYRNYDLDYEFPNYIKKVNPNIITIRDYVKWVDGGLDLSGIYSIIGVGMLAGYFFISNKKKRRK